MDLPDRPAPRLDVDHPSSARIYDYFLGGGHNFEVDRQAAEALAAVHPAIGAGMRANRSFLRRAVSYLAGEGIDQFLDLGSGIPTVGNVHEIAQRLNPAAGVVYVDLEPIAVTHSNTILADNPKATAIQLDLRDWERVLDAAGRTSLLDLDRPLGVVLAGVLQYVADIDKPERIIAGYVDRIAPGSFVAMSHPSTDELPAGRLAGTDQVTGVYDRTATPFTYRTKGRFESFFDGLRLVDPGVVHVWSWRPEPDTDTHEFEGRITGFAGVGRKHR